MSEVLSEGYNMGPSYDFFDAILEYYEGLCDILKG